MNNKELKAETEVQQSKNAELLPSAPLVANPVLAAVPYQCCPLCNGTGQIVADGFTSSVYQTCKVCNGVRIIPMHIVDWRFNVKA